MSDLPSTRLPSYEEATQDTGAFQPNPSVARVILEIEDGVQIFHIGDSGSVSAPSYPDRLRVYRAMRTVGELTCRPLAWLQVSDWTYPLFGQQSTILKTPYGAYIFPDGAAGQGSY